VSEIKDTTQKRRKVPAAESRLRKNLAHAVERMKEMREQYRALPGGHGYDRGAVTGFDLALDAIHSWTEGEFGEDWKADES
jgi:hypothetical protein